MVKNIYIRIILIVGLFLFYNSLIANAFIVFMLLLNGESLSDPNFFQAFTRHPAIIGTGTFIADVLLITTLWAFQLIRKRPLSSASHPSFRGWGLALVAFFLCVVGVNFLFSAFHLDDGGTTDLFNGMLNNIFCIGVVTLVSPLAEECVFREGLQRQFFLLFRPYKRLAAWLPVLLSSLLFGAVHMNFAQALPAVFIGIILGVFYLRAGDIRLSFLAHVVNNALAVVSMKITALQAAEDEMSLVASLGIGSGCLLAGLLLLSLWWKKSKPTKARTGLKCEPTDLS